MGKKKVNKSERSADETPKPARRSSPPSLVSSSQYARLPRPSRWTGCIDATVVLFIYFGSVSSLSLSFSYRVWRLVFFSWSPSVARVLFRWDPLNTRVTSIDRCRTRINSETIKTEWRAEREEHYTCKPSTSGVSAFRMLAETYTPIRMNHLGNARTRACVVIPTNPSRGIRPWQVERNEIRSVKIPGDKTQV